MDRVNPRLGLHRTGLDPRRGGLSRLVRVVAILRVGLQRDLNRHRGERAEERERPRSHRTTRPLMAKSPMVTDTFRFFVMKRPGFAKNMK